MPKLDVWGEPIAKDGGIGPDIVSPFYLSNHDQKLVNEEALRLGLKVTIPARDVGAASCPQWVEGGMSALGR